MTILQIDSSISGADSVTRRLTSDIVERIGGLGSHVIRRDLAAEPLAHLTARGQDEHLLDEFILADVVVIGAPMYNFTIPSQLKAWLDRLAVAGRSFRYTEAGPEGLLVGKRVIVRLHRAGSTVKTARSNMPAAISRPSSTSSASSRSSLTLVVWRSVLTRR